MSRKNNLETNLQGKKSKEQIGPESLWNPSRTSYNKVFFLESALAPNVKQFFMIQKMSVSPPSPQKNLHAHAIVCKQVPAPLFRHPHLDPAFSPFLKSLFLFFSPIFCSTPLLRYFKQFPPPSHSPLLP